MAYTGRFGQSEEYRREELIRVIEHSVENLTLQELDALYYDMSTKNYINDYKCNNDSLDATFNSGLWADKQKDYG